MVATVKRKSDFRYTTMLKTVLPLQHCFCISFELYFLDIHFCYFESFIMSPFFFPPIFFSITKKRVLIHPPTTFADCQYLYSQFVNNIVNYSRLHSTKKWYILSIIFCIFSLTERIRYQLYPKKIGV